MRYETKLMYRVFSDNTPEDFKEKVADKIDEAKATGTAELVDGEGNDLSMEKMGDKVVIEDNANNGEITVAKKNEDGSTSLEAAPSEDENRSKFSASLPNVRSEAPDIDDEDDLSIENSTPDVEVTIDRAVDDRDKSGTGKSFSLTFRGFRTPSEANRFFSSLMLFSDDAVDEVEDKVQEAQELKERLDGTGDPEVAEELKDAGEEIKAYSYLAAGYGYPTGHLYEAGAYYSAVADEYMNYFFSQQSVVDTLYSMDDYEVNAMFSTMDPYEANVIASIYDSGDRTYTFSDAELIADAAAGEEELNKPVEEVVDNIEEEGGTVENLLKPMTDSEVKVMSRILEDNPNATFSEINDGLALANTGVTELFSVMDDYEANAIFSDLYPSEQDVLFSMIESGNYLYSDFLNYLEDSRYFSDEDVEELSDNANEVMKAADDLQEDPDSDLAKKVKVLADVLTEEAEKAEDAGHDTEDVQRVMSMVSDFAYRVYSDLEDEEDIDDTDENDEGLRARLEDAREIDRTNAECPRSSEGEEPTSENYSYYGGAGEMRLFSDGGYGYDGGGNSCFTSRID